MAVITRSVIECLSWRFGNIGSHGRYSRLADDTDATHYAPPCRDAVVVGGPAEGLRASSCTDSDAVSVWVNELDLSAPRLRLDHHTELGGQIIDGLDVEIGNRSGGHIAGVLGQVEVRVTALQEDVEREPFFEPVLADYLEAETSIPTQSVLGVVHTKDGHQLLRHPTTLSQDGLACLPPPVGGRDYVVPQLGRDAARSSCRATEARGACYRVPSTGTSGTWLAGTSEAASRWLGASSDLAESKHSACSFDDDVELTIEL
jgi:hypothetical protein